MTRKSDIVAKPPHKAGAAMSVMSKHKQTARRAAIRAVIGHHEGSHAVIARVLDIDCPYVAMFATDEAGTPAVQTRSATYLARDADQATQLIAIGKDITVALAGPCGEEKHRKSTKKHPEQWRGDVELAHNLAIRAALVATGVDVRSLAQNPDGSVNVSLNADQLAYANDLIRQCRDAASDLIDANWLAIERVAQALMTCELLDQAELDRLIAAAETERERV